jgi:hypothetical protein
MIRADQRPAPATNPAWVMRARRGSDTVAVRFAAREGHLENFVDLRPQR